MRAQSRKNAATLPAVAKTPRKSPVKTAKAEAPKAKAIPPTGRPTRFTFVEFSLWKFRNQIADKFKKLFEESFHSTDLCTEITLYNVQLLERHVLPIFKEFSDEAKKYIGPAWFAAFEQIFFDVLKEDERVTVKRVAAESITPEDWAKSPGILQLSDVRTIYIPHTVLIVRKKKTGP